MSTPDLGLADEIFALRRTNDPEVRAKILSKITEKNLAPLFRVIVAENLVPANDPKLKEMEGINEAKVAELKAAIEAAETAEDEAQVQEAWVNLGNYYAEICDRANAVETLEKALTLTASSGAKIDIIFTICRLGFFFRDRAFAGEKIAALKSLVEKEGDWERKNRYKTYRGLHLLSIRQFKEGADLLIDSFATFTCTELMTYTKVIELGIAAGTLVLGRTDMKKKIVDSPEILSRAPHEKSLQPLTELTNSIYTGDYKTFFAALYNIKGPVLDSFWALAPHSDYYVREMRCKGYSQLLESYMALNMKSMADAFGVSVEFLDRDLGRMIPHKKLNCAVDKVNGVIITNRPDSKNAQYQQLIKSGDALLTKLQKYSAAIRLYGNDDHIA